jgi:chromosomal replication initiation ATPase DnaA
MKVHDLNTAAEAVAFICLAYGTSPERLESENREFEASVWPRWLFIYLLSRFTMMDAKQIGFLVNRDRGTVMHALEGIENEVNRSCARSVELARITLEFQSRLRKKHKPAQPAANKLGELFGELTSKF